VSFGTAQGGRFERGAAADGWTDDVGGPSRLVSLMADDSLTALLRLSLFHVAPDTGAEYESNDFSLEPAAEQSRPLC
jgi:hypothetical protein